MYASWIQKQVPVKEEDDGWEVVGGGENGESGGNGEMDIDEEVDDGEEDGETVDNGGEDGGELVEDIDELEHMDV